MARPKALGDIEVEWAHLQRARGCLLEDIATVLGVTRKTLYNEFRERGLKNPSPIPDDEWLFPTT